MGEECVCEYVFISFHFTLTTTSVQFQGTAGFLGANGKLSPGKMLCPLPVEGNSINFHNSFRQQASRHRHTHTHIQTSNGVERYGTWSSVGVFWQTDGCRVFFFSSNRRKDWKKKQKTSMICCLCTLRAETEQKKRQWPKALSPFGRFWGGPLSGIYNTMGEGCSLALVSSLLIILGDFSAWGGLAGRATVRGTAVLLWGQFLVCIFLVCMCARWWCGNFWKILGPRSARLSFLCGGCFSSSSLLLGTLINSYLSVAEGWRTMQ